VHTLYWLRPDGVPSVIKSVPHEKVMRLGLSLSAICTRVGEEDSETHPITLYETLDRRSHQRVPPPSRLSSSHPIFGAKTIVQ
jgi:hypothetical protein